MKSAVLAVTLLAAASGSASAGTYLGIGIGTAPALTGEGTDNIEGDGRSGKLLLGNKFGKLAIEGALTKYSLSRTNDRGTVVDFGDVYQAAAALKLNFPLGNNFEAFGRGGLHKTFFRHATQDFDGDGTGFLVGGGVELKLNLGVGGGSLFLDYQVSNANVVGDDNGLDMNMTSRVWMLGLTVGI